LFSMSSTEHDKSQKAKHMDRKKKYRVIAGRTPSIRVKEMCICVKKEISILILMLNKIVL
jgi:hypothetical protein